MTEGNKYWDEEKRAFIWDGCHWDDMQGVVMNGMMGMCGCQDDEAFEKLITTLKSCDRSDFLESGDKSGWKTMEDICSEVGESDVIAHILLQYLDNMGLIEHGTSIRGAWTTSKGNECLKAYSLIGK